jgi:DNA-binding transcriptional LysR family regulator
MMLGRKLAPATLRRMQEIDLNLLPTLRALLEEEHVTRAAERLHLSVPATSRALDRCRRTFADPLLVRHGRGVVATPRGRQLLTELVPVLESIEQLLGARRPFDPALVRTTFVVRANEAVVAAMASALVDVVRQAAPNAGLRFEAEAADDLDRLADESVHLAIGSYRDVPRELAGESLVTERMVVAMGSEHSAASRRLTLKRFAALDHIVASRRGESSGPVDGLLAERGLNRRVVAVVPTFAAALALVIAGDGVALVPSRLASLFADGGRVVLRPSPLPLPEVDVQQIWHGRLTIDPEHVWFRACVRAAADRVQAGAEPASSLHLTQL